MRVGVLCFPLSDGPLGHFSTSPSLCSLCCNMGTGMVHVCGSQRDGWDAREGLAQCLAQSERYCIIIVILLPPRTLSPPTQPCLSPGPPPLTLLGWGRTPDLCYPVDLPGLDGSASTRRGKAQWAVFAARQMFLKPCFLFCCWAICFYSLSFLQGGFERLPLLQWMFPVRLHQATFNENQFKVFFLIKCLIVALAAPLWK